MPSKRVFFKKLFSSGLEKKENEMAWCQVSMLVKFRVIRDAP
jgi:hypothetical protein